MALLTPDDPGFADIEARHAWFDAVLRADCGEILGSEEPLPVAVDWPKGIPDGRSFDIVQTECSLARVAANGYTVSVWEASGDDEEGDPLWTFFLVDDAGVRYLPEYSVIDENAPLEMVDRVLSRSMDEVPRRLAAGEFDRDLPPLTLPGWLLEPVDRPETDNSAWT